MFRSLVACTFLLTASLIAGCSSNDSDTRRTSHEASKGKSDGPIALEMIWGDNTALLVGEEDVEKFSIAVPRTGDHQKMPMVEITTEDSGFLCDLLGVTRSSLVFDEVTGTLIDTYEIDVAWSPGADSSGCQFSVTNPYDPTMIATGELFMSF